MQTILTTGPSIVSRDILLDGWFGASFQNRCMAAAGTMFFIDDHVPSRRNQSYRIVTAWWKIFFQISFH
jgi:hypothetical protein